MTFTYAPRPTMYANTTFRSRLEAKWAQVFDRLEIRWRYEPQGYLLDSSWRPNTRTIETHSDRAYLPDFHLPDLDMWVEVKGTESNLDRTLMAWAAACLPSLWPAFAQPAWGTTRRLRTPYRRQGHGGKLLLLGPVPHRDCAFTLLTPIPWGRSTSATGSLYAFKVDLRALIEHDYDSWEPWKCAVDGTNEIVREEYLGSVVLCDGILYEFAQETTSYKRLCRGEDLDAPDVLYRLYRSLLRRREKMQQDRDSSTLRDFLALARRLDKIKSTTDLTKANEDPFNQLWLTAHNDVRWLNEARTYGDQYGQLSTVDEALAYGRMHHDELTDSVYTENRLPLIRAPFARPARNALRENNEIEEALAAQGAAIAGGRRGLLDELLDERGNAMPLDMLSPPGPDADFGVAGDADMLMSQIERIGLC